MIICTACHAKNPTGTRTCASCHADLIGRAGPTRNTANLSASLPSPTSPNTGHLPAPVLLEPEPLLEPVLEPEPLLEPVLEPEPLLEPILEPWDGDDDDDDDAIVGELIADPIDDGVAPEMWSIDDGPRGQISLGAPLRASQTAPPAPESQDQGFSIQEAPLITDRGAPNDLPTLREHSHARAAASSIDLPPVQPRHHPTPAPPSSGGSLHLPRPRSAPDQVPQPTLAPSSSPPPDEIPAGETPHPDNQRLTPAVLATVLERDSRGEQWLETGDDEEPVVGRVDDSPSRVHGRYVLGQGREEGVQSRPVIAEVVIATGGEDVDGDAVISVERLPEFPDLPQVVDGQEHPGSGLIALALYAFQGRGLVAHQKNVLKRFGNVLARLKRGERSSIETLGRKARHHNIVPPGLEDVAETADLLEHGADKQRKHANEKKKEHLAAERAYETTKETGEARLAKLEAHHAPLTARIQEMRRRRGSSSSRFEELHQQEKEHRSRVETPLSDDDLGGDIQLIDGKIVVNQRSAEEEIALRKTEHETSLRELARVTKELKTLDESIESTREPMARLEAEMKKVHAVIDATHDKLREIEGQAKVAALSGKRRTDLANLSASELDQELGRSLLRSDKPERRLEKLINNVERAHQRVVKVEALVNQQQDQLEAFDKESSKRGWQILIGGSIGGALALVALVQLALVLLGPSQ